MQFEAILYKRWYHYRDIYSRYNALTKVGKFFDNIENWLGALVDKKYKAEIDFLRLLHIKNEVTDSILCSNNCASILITSQYKKKNTLSTIEEYNSISPKKVSEESLIKCKNKEGVEKKADIIVGLIVIILSISIGCWISNKVVDPINEVSGALLTAWFMGAAFFSYLAFCILGTITFYIFKIDKIVEKIIYKKMYAAEIEYYERLSIRDLDNKNKQFEK